MKRGNMSDNQTLGYFTRSRKRSLEQEKDEQERIGEPARETESPLECAICLQTCVHPAKLPCSHIFCFICLKGTAHNGRRCAMCRAPIPTDYVNNPVLVEPYSVASESDQESYKWFYEGRHGWWEYDDRSNAIIEEIYASKAEYKLELLLAGYLFVIDLKEMKQYRKSDRIRERRIKRDFRSCESIGIAGIRKPGSRPFRSAVRRLPTPLSNAGGPLGALDDILNEAVNAYNHAESILGSSFLSLGSLLGNSMSSLDTFSQDSYSGRESEVSTHDNEVLNISDDSSDAISVISELSEGESENNCSFELPGSVNVSIPSSDDSYVIDLTSDSESDEESLQMSNDGGFSLNSSPFNSFSPVSSRSSTPEPVHDSNDDSNDNSNDNSDDLLSIFSFDYQITDNSTGIPSEPDYSPESSNEDF